MDLKLDMTDYIMAARIMVDDNLLGSAAKSAGGIALGERNHLIDAFVGKIDGPTLIAVASLHGNEPAGAIALSNLSARLSKLANDLRGRVYFIAGNLRALAEQTRFIDSDLNRHWTPQNLSSVGSSTLAQQSEGVELTELDRLLDSILITAMDEVFVIDLHSTSADGMPFATVGDTLRNREFARTFPIPILLGIEEQLDGTMLEYLNNTGAVTFGFEGGQHLSDKTVKNHEALIWVALLNSRILDESQIPDLEKYRQRLGHRSGKSQIFEVRYRHAITESDGFKMNAGFNNFDRVKKGQIVAMDKNGAVRALESGRLLMPLYQKLGEDGFFVGREISRFWLWLSKLLRTTGVQKIIHILPGVHIHPGDPATLEVDTRVARLFPLQVFHLLGFRRRRWNRSKLVVSRRKHDTDGPFKWKGK